VIVASRKPQPRKSLAEFSPRVAAMANGWDPTKVSSHSKKKLEWICNFGHIWQCIVGDMTAKNLGCPYCSGQRTLSGFNDLSTKFPEIALQAHGWDPTTVTPHSGKKMEWKCKNGHVSTAQISSRTAGNGCPYCSGSKTLASFNDLTTTHPQLATQAHGWDPHHYSKGSNYLAEWICMHGHVWKTVISDRTSKNIGCPYCSGKRALAGFNDLTTTHPQLATQAHGWDPTTVTKGSGKVKDWRCGSGHVFKMIIQERTDRGLGCQYCSGKQVLHGFNDLVTVEPEIAAQAHGWDPTTVTKGSKQIKKWKCKERHVWNAAIYARTGSDRTGCPSCAQTGFSPNLDGWLYFLDHDEWQMFQIGITNFPDDRLARHKGIGWTVLEVRGAMDGAATRTLETAILQTLKRRGAVFANKSDGRKFDGWSESWLKASVKVSGLKDLLDFVHEDEST